MLHFTGLFVHSVLSDFENVMEEAFKNSMLPSDLPGQSATFICKCDAFVRLMQNISFLGQACQHFRHAWWSKTQTLRYLCGRCGFLLLFQAVDCLQILLGAAGHTDDI
jgi:hypothetical protein